jgi:anaerobic selenocysteine-containing dehydrogenase
VPDRIAQPWGNRTPYGRGDPWPVRVDQHLAKEVGEESVERWVQSASVLHSNGDGIDIAVGDGRIVGVRGRAGDRVNHGRLDPKDFYGWQANGSPERLTRPLVRENGQLVETDWDTAMRRIVTRSRELLDLVETIPHWAPPTHAMQIFRYVEQGSIGLLWISATNPAVSLPELGRVRSALGSGATTVVVQDLFLTETASLADVVLPAAAWGEKTGTFTNADRTVHLSEKAVEPPGEARPDLDIFLDYARRMDFRDRDGGPLVPWDSAESAFEAWKECSRGRPCDYSALSYERLRGSPGIQWPCTGDAPDGTERLYADGIFNTHTDYTETYGNDLGTGAADSEQEHRAKAPEGRAYLQAAPYEPAPEEPDDDFPLLLTTGRTIYHFHTRTKTGRAPELDAAAPDVWVELSSADADALGVAEGDMLRIRSRRGIVEAPARVGGIRRGVLFIPFHYGYWDGGEARAANELTLTSWDPVSKQPIFKVAAVRVEG